MLTTSPIGATSFSSSGLHVEGGALAEIFVSAQRHQMAALGGIASDLRTVPAPGHFTRAKETMGGDIGRDMLAGGSSEGCQFWPGPHRPAIVAAIGADVA